MGSIGVITFGSLFAGIGGIDLGLERAGMICKWQVEIDDYATKILEKHWPDVSRFRDVRDCGSHNLIPVDLICGGFPCQDISQMGNRTEGINGRQSGLWSEFYRVICELRPRYVIVENVSDLLVRGMGQVLGDLAEIGYDAEWECLPAIAFGKPHLRKRIFIVAYTGGTESRLRWDTQRIQIKEVDWQRFLLSTRGGNVNGIPHRVDRLRGLGNAVVPQKAEWIGQQIMRFEQ